MAIIICPECHYTGKPAKKKRGSTKIEFWGWMIFPLGLPYTIWRMCSKTPKCKYCDNTILIPAESPVGRTLLAKINEDPLPELAPRPKPVEKPAPQAKEEAPPPAHQAVQTKRPKDDVIW